MSVEVMIDLETLSTESSAAIISIGAVKFDPRGAIGTTGDGDPDYMPFRQNIDLYSLEEAGLHFGGQTIKWWMEQSPEARESVLADAVDIGTALSRFYVWFGDKSMPTWGNGAGFDNVILRNAYQKLGGQCPFKFSHDRCFRTMKALFPDVPYVVPAIPHDPLQDAEAQVVHLQKLYNFISQR